MPGQGLAVSHALLVQQPMKAPRHQLLKIKEPMEKSSQRFASIRDYWPACVVPSPPSASSFLPKRHAATVIFIE
jgi:hypothetical protein